MALLRFSSDAQASPFEARLATETKQDKIIPVKWFLSTLNRSEAMFGGYGLYLGGVFFAILARDTLFLKADDETRGDFVNAGLAVFTYAARGKPRSLSFYAAPERALEEPGQLEPWVRKAVAAGDRARTKKAAAKNGKKKS